MFRGSLNRIATAESLPGEFRAHTPPLVSAVIDRRAPIVNAAAVNRWNAIAAMSLNRVIGAGNRIPWHLPEDFQWFKQMTTGHVVVMGRRTFETIGKPLPNRETFVLSRGGFSHPGVRTVGDLSDIPALTADRAVFICGGAQVYAEALPLCAELYLTLVKRTVAGDAFFPPFEDQFQRVATLRDGEEFSILHYRNASPAVCPALSSNG